MNKFWSIFYPIKCPVCGKLLGGKRIACCEACRKDLPVITGARCYRCGKPLQDEEQEYCMDCRKRQHFYTKGLALWTYNAHLKQVIYRFKYKNHRVYASYFGRELVRHHYRELLGWQADMLVPVPLHQKRRRQRGFNQATLLAGEIARCIKVPVREDVVVRVRNTTPQKKLNDKERQKNLKSAFKIKENSVKLKKIILVDDIYTTGTTVDAIAQLLEQAGAAKIYVLTLCIGKGY